MNHINKCTQHQIPDLGQVQTIAADLNVLMVPDLIPYLKQQDIERHTIKYQFECFNLIKKKTVLTQMNIH